MSCSTDISGVCHMNVSLEQLQRSQKRAYRKSTVFAERKKQWNIVNRILPSSTNTQDTVRGLFIIGLDKNSEAYKKNCWITETCNTFEN